MAADIDATTPKSATVDGNTVAQFDPDQQIKAAVFNAANASMATKNRGLRFNKIIGPPQIGNTTDSSGDFGGGA
jgi:hypothetical protein